MQICPTCKILDLGESALDEFHCNYDLCLEEWYLLSELPAKMRFMQKKINFPYGT